VKAHKTSGGRKMPVRHTIPLGIVIFLVLDNSRKSKCMKDDYHRFVTM